MSSTESDNYCLASKWLGYIKHTYIGKETAKIKLFAHNIKWAIITVNSHILSEGNSLSEASCHE